MPSSANEPPASTWIHPFTSPARRRAMISKVITAGQRMRRGVRGAASFMPEGERRSGRGKRLQVVPLLPLPSSRWQDQRSVSAPRSALATSMGIRTASASPRFALVTFLIAASLAAQRDWTPARVALGTGRLAFDAARGRLVMVGAAAWPTLVNETFEWRGSWQHRPSSHLPPPRVNFASAYDAARRNVVLFGGAVDATTLLGDTWVWDGFDWTQMPT